MTKNNYVKTVIILVGVLCIVFFISGENPKDNTDQIPEVKPIMPRWEKGDKWVVAYRYAIGLDDSEGGVHELSEEDFFLYEIIKVDSEKKKEAIVEVHEISKKGKLDKLCDIYFHYSKRRLYYKAIGMALPNNQYIFEAENLDKEGRVFLDKLIRSDLLISSFPSFPVYITTGIFGQEITSMDIIIGVGAGVADPKYFSRGQSFTVQKWEKGKKWWSKAEIRVKAYPEGKEFYQIRTFREGRLLGEEETKKILGKVGNND